MSWAVLTDSLEVRWKWKEHGKNQFLSNCFSHYVLKQLISSYPWNIFFLIYSFTIDSIVIIYFQFILLRLSF